MLKTEIEAKFLRVNPDAIRARLRKLDAECKQPMRLMRRVVFDNDYMNKKQAFVRVRDEGYRISVTYKQYDEISLTGAKEIEFTVDDYDTAVAFMEAAGVHPRSHQEARREIWKLNGAEVVIDEWPWIDPFIEVEAHSEELVKETAVKLGYEWSEAVFGDVMTAYRAQYPNTGFKPEDMVYNLANVRFKDTVPIILRS
jgi:adenylate cyclase class 2